MADYSWWSSEISFIHQDKNIFKILYYSLSEHLFLGDKSFFIISITLLKIIPDMPAAGT